MSNVLFSSQQLVFIEQVASGQSHTFWQWNNSVYHQLYHLKYPYGELNCEYSDTVLINLQYIVQSYYCYLLHFICKYQETRWYNPQNFLLSDAWTKFWKKKKNIKNVLVKFFKC